MGLTQITTGGLDGNINIDSNTLKVDGTNNRVGIGAADVNAPLEVRSSSALQIRTSTGTGNYWEFGRDDGTGDFFLADDGLGTVVTVDQLTGNVGIGTTSPGYKLEVTEGSSNSVVRFTGANSANLVFRNASSNVFELNAGGSNDALSFGTAGNNERMRIDSSGNVIIGTTTAATDSRLTVRAVSPALSLYATPGNESFLNMGDTDDHNIGRITYDNSNNAMRFDTNAAERMRIDSSGNVQVSTGQFTVGTTASTGLQFINDGTFGTINSADLKFRTVSAERMRIDTSGRLLVGASTGQGNSLLQVEGDSSSAAAQGSISLRRGLNTAAIGGNVGADLGKITFGGNDGTVAAAIASQSDAAWGATSDCPGRILFSTTADGTSSPAERLRISQNGNVGINTTSSSNKLRIHEGSDTPNVVIVTGADESSEFLALGINSGVPCVTAGGVSSTDAALAFRTADNGTESERMRIDRSGNVGIGETSPASLLTVGGNAITTAKPTVCVFPSSGNSSLTLRGGASTLSFDITGAGNNGTIIYDSNSDLLFKNGTLDSSTEKMRLDSLGRLLVGKTSSQANDNGAELRGGSSEYAGTFSASAHTVMLINRNTNDGQLIQFRQGGTQEGTISVSGNTVTYGGGHLARWSQLAGGAERIEILRGSVLSNLDEMCEWGEEDNEVLNRMKVSDVEGDSNVSGVFQCWDDDDDVYTNDFYCAMTGDFVIRIAQGTTVARGDLLMSAGDGTAKPQDDDIVRSKTIAKVTSTTVSTTYSDGSYCVPCVLMAC